MYPNQSGCHFNVGSVIWYGKMHIKNSFYGEIYNSLLLILQRHIQVMNFIHYEECQAVMSWIFSGNLAADTVSCLQ